MSAPSCDVNQTMSAVSRVLFVDKPVGPTSFDVVRRARQGFTGRVGHAGTLDPFATGLLLVLLGQATRLSQFLVGLPKEYEVTVQFGASSSTGDPTGEITETSGRVDRASVLQAMDGLRGDIIQKVPLTSAVKVGGEALYKKAHRGETADTPQRQVSIYDLCLLDFAEDAQTARILAVTSSGTYLRVLAQDLGKVLGVGAFALELRRMRIGRFSVCEALGLGDLSPERYGVEGPGVLSLDQALAGLPALELDETRARLAANGNKLNVEQQGRFRAYGQGRLLGVYEGQAGVASPLVVFPEGA
jgi:tRNA pseudouridine55 synthase